MPVTLGHLRHCSSAFFFILPLGTTIKHTLIYIYTHTHTYIYTYVFITAMEKGLRLDTRRLPNGGEGIDHHDGVSLRERHHITPIRPFIELNTPCDGHCGHAASHHVIVLELVPDEVCVLWAGLLEKAFEVVHRQPHPMLVVACGSWGAPHAEGSHLTVVAVDRGHGPLKALLVPLFSAFDALLGDVGGDVRRRLPITSRGRLPASLGGAKLDCVVAGGDDTRHIERVPEEVAMSALSWALRDTQVARPCYLSKLHR
jgi:hypothetical protein